VVVSKVTLRPATEADVEDIAELQATAYWSNFNDLEPGSHDHPGYRELVWSSAKQDALEDWPHATLATIESEVAGVSFVFKKLGLIGGLWVKPDFQGRGVGTELIASALSNAEMKKAALITIEVHPKNPAVRLYERSGFKLAEVTTRHSKGLGRDLPLWVMTRTI
jgi:[ribosomal protein S18]-alanine N-acetyltransferase